MTIALTGFMGCGKSHVAACIAGKTGGFFFDLDDTIQIGEGLSVSEIFETHGEAAFRLLELEYLDRIICDYAGFPTDMVLSLGGGTILTPQCAELIKKNAVCVYLRASVDELVRNLEITGIEHRPVLAGTDDLHGSVATLLEKRAPIYEKAADIILDVDGLSFDEVADRIIAATDNLPIRTDILFRS
ncbi:MAG: hypothetical protein KBS53_00500 [Bacteroidales bacterium]|nr:hypothetical protein [Candidatus Hennigimonas equi]